MGKRGYGPLLSVAGTMVLWLSLFYPSSVQAHNGRVALAAPVEGIIVDGDLSDWPESRVRYPICLLEGGTRPKDTQDLEGTFLIGYNADENALYVGVEVRDESIVIDTTASRSTQDGCEIYVDVAHKKDDSDAVEYAIRGDQGGSRGWRDVQMKVTREREEHRYEWRIDIGEISEGKMHLHAKVVLGFDVMLYDRDKDGSFSLMAWGRGRQKSLYAENRGDVVLAGKDTGIGSVRGRVRWEGRREGVTHAKVRIQSFSSERLWVYVETDRDGMYALEMPEGKYRIEAAGLRRGMTEHVMVEVREGGAEEATLVVELPTGCVVKAGGGRVVKAGMGIRRGSWQSFGVLDGLPSLSVFDILQDREGNLWFGTWAGGVSRYDGEQFVTFTTEDGLANNEVWSILEDQEGNLWFATWGGGVSRYDGEQFVTFAIEDGLANNEVWSILEDREGNLWFGTEGGGVSRYDGEKFTTFTTEDGLANNQVWSILEDREGHLWFGTWGGGVNRYDGFVFQHLCKRDGLVHDAIQDILQDRNGDIWIATEEGATRYRPGHTSPGIRLTDVVTDRRYGPMGEIRVPSSQHLLAFEFQGRSLKTHWDQMVYVYLLEGYDKDWRKTRERRVEYTGLPRGSYVFQVKAVDRDLNYSEAPATVRVTIHLPYGRIMLVGGLVLSLTGLAIVSGYAVKRRRELVAAMERELQAAHDVQMGLLPETDPQIPGFDIAGLCIPANSVGGDHYTYIWLDAEKTKLAIIIADVSGKEMKAAMTVMRFAEDLHYETQDRHLPEEILAGLNRSLWDRLEERMYVTACVGVLDILGRCVEVSNAGHPPVYHLSGENGEVVELKAPGSFLGIRPDAKYRSTKVKVEKEDMLVFYTDGVLEARDGEGRVYGFDRLEGVIRDMDRELGAREMIDRILGDVEQFTGTSQRDDDMTMVVLRML